MTNPVPIISGCSQRLMAESPTLLPTYPGQEIAATANGPGQATTVFFHSVLVL